METSPLLLYVFVALLAVTAAVGVGLFRKRRELDLQARLLLACLPSTLVVVLGYFAKRVSLVALTNWNAARLAPSFALAHGYPLYAGRDSGPLLGDVYGPIKTLVYMPATLAASPLTALVVAACMTLGFVFLPVLWMHLGGVRRRPGTLLLRCGTFACFVLFACRSEVLGFAAFWVHADAPALGFAAAACAIVYRGWHRDGWEGAAASAMFAALAVGSKQVALPLVVALPLFVLLADGRRACLRYSVALAVIGAALAGASLLVFGAEPMLFNTLTAPANEPWVEPGGARALAGGFQLLIHASLLPAVVALACALCGRAADATGGVGAWLRRNRWSLMLLVAIFLIPTSVLGRIKVAGAPNALSYSTYFVAAAASLGLMERAGGSEGAAAAARSFVAVAVAAVTAALVLPTATGMPTIAGHLRENQTQQAYDFAQGHPGETYFPWHPLSVLAAEGKLYHFGDAISCRDRAGFPISREHFLAHFPERARYVAFSTPAFGSDIYNRELVMSFLPEFEGPVELSELPGWLVYRRR